MSNIYTWKIYALDVKPSIGTLKDYIVNAHWIATRSDGNGHLGSASSTVSFKIDEKKQDYIPYDKLKEEQIIEWVKDSLGEEGVAAAYATIEGSIQNQINPPIITPPLPWSPKS